MSNECVCYCRYLARLLVESKSCILNSEIPDISFKDIGNPNKRLQIPFKEYLDSLSVINKKNLYHECSNCNCCERHKNNFPNPNNVLDEFVKNEDIKVLINENLNVEQSIETFVHQLRDYFKLVWRPEFHDQLKLLDSGKLYDLNKILSYPSYGGYAILDDSFTGPCEDIDILSDTSKSLLGYFYGIHLH
jgi:hypothetical protein